MPSNTEIDQRPPVVRFFDAFFQEQNIKWMLGIGTLILLGSSTMLVVSHWDDYTPLWKYLILFGYTVSIHVAGQFAYHRLSLQKTGAALMALTVLLIPLGFLSVRWIHPEGMTVSAIFSQFGMLALLAANAAFAYFAAVQILTLLLRRSQPTLIGSYLLLSLAGAIVPVLPASWAPLTALVLWAIFTIGAVKANRHVFWLTEELRWPRIFGFFPIALLGLQFTILFALGIASHLSTHWIGFGLVLTAIPILLTANTLADVFEKRNTELNTRYPASLVLPIFVGLGLMIAGVFVSAAGYPGTFALVPSALLASVVLGVTAHRTRHVGFVWGCLVFALVAYQTSPVFFMGLAKAVVASGAAAVNESRLPLAFYGITYLPVLALATGLSLWFTAKGEKLFAKPLRQFSMGLPILLVVLAATHVKACFPVGMLLALVIGIQLFAFRERALLLVMLVAMGVATAGSIPFAKQVFELSAGWQAIPTVWLLFATLLVTAGRWLDRVTQQRCPASTSWVNTAPFCQLTSLGIVLIASTFWLVALAAGDTLLIPGVLCVVLLVAHSVRWRNDMVSIAALGFPILAAMAFADLAGWGFTAQFTLATAMLGALTVLETVLAARPDSLWTDAFQKPALIVASAGTVIAQVMLCVLAVNALIHLRVDTFPEWIAVAIVIPTAAWLAVKRQISGLTSLNWILTLSLSALATRILLGFDQGLVWLPVVWSTLGLLSVPAIRFAKMRRTSDDGVPQSSFIQEWESCVGLTLGAIAILGMPILTGQLRIAGLVATAGAIWLTYGTASSPLKTGLLAIANGHLLIFVVQFCCPGLRHFGEMTAEQLRLTAFPLAWAMALSAWGWERRKLSTEASPNIPSTAFQALSLFCVAAVLHRNAIPLTLSQLVTLILMFVTLILLHGWMAIKKTPPTIDEDKPHAMEGATFHVWVSILLAAACLGSLWWFGVIAISGTVGLFTPIVLAFAAAAVSYFSKRSTSLAAFVEPFERVAITLPALTVFAGLSRQFNVASPNWLGINSLAMLMASGFYFWRGLETRTAGPLFGSLGIFNLLLVMIWQELQWSDPQLFMIPMGFSVLLMVETLRDKIPTSLHNPLRYAGALTILVSPTFHIVGGSWLHLVTLMVVSVVIVLVAMGLRVKALMYTGTAFLIADMIAIVVRGSFDNPNLLWLVGIAIGAAVIGLAAYCERHREQMLQRLRLLSAQLETWS